MKISYRILIFVLLVVAFVFASSILTFYSVTGKIVLGLAGAALSLVLVLLLLDKNARAKIEHSGFLALINQNLSLREMSDAVLANIISATRLTVGRLFIVDNGQPRILSSFGLLNETSLTGNKIDLYQRVIEKGEEAEFHFTENFPVVHSGIVALSIRYLLIYPVVYNQKVIAVLEMASVSQPRKGVKEYLANIKDQLAAGLSKAYAMSQLENLVRELKVNNEKAPQQEEGVQAPTGENTPKIDSAVKTEEEKATPKAEAMKAIFTEDESGVIKDGETALSARKTSEELQREIEKRASHSILIADSNSDNRKIIARYLTAKHYNVLQSAGVMESLKEIEEKKPFAVTLSLNAQDQAPWEVLKKIKEGDQTRSLPVIMYNTVDPLNFGYGLQVYEYLFRPLGADEISLFAERLSALSKREVKNIICAGFEEGEIQRLKGELKENSVKITYVKEPTAAFRMILKLQPELVLIDAFMDKGGSISLLDRLKTSFETREIPVVMCLRPEPGKEDLALLDSSIEKVTIRAKGHRIDILKAIRDRILLEEGFTEEDTSSILIEGKTGEDETPEGTAGQGAKRIPSNKVLIVDDDANTLSAICEVVNKAGCESVLAKSGMECISMLQKFKPDLILLDIMMPQMDGFETIKRIKAERNLKDIPVFALTAHEMIEEKEILIRNGFDDFVSKPVNSGSLSFKIEKVLNNITEFEK
ncbi:MAG: response regulator [Ignavibacteria bacterium]|jgi:CheY-like chemotaxis protein|nr:response regulator [Ignavibacteria bacterium]MCU7503770.1 response regulator [Ignavibacteria bacterium]MCU7517216.1 response regulator [Ignavibacteria bacterium]